MGNNLSLVRRCSAPRSPIVADQCAGGPDEPGRVLQLPAVPLRRAPRLQMTCSHDRKPLQHSAALQTLPRQLRLPAPLLRCCQSGDRTCSALHPVNSHRQNSHMFRVCSCSAPNHSFRSPPLACPWVWARSLVWRLPRKSRAGTGEQ